LRLRIYIKVRIYISILYLIFLLPNIVNGSCLGITIVHNVEFKIFGYYIWQRVNDTFYCNGFFLDLTLLFKFKNCG